MPTPKPNKYKLTVLIYLIFTVLIFGIYWFTFGVEWKTWKHSTPLMNNFTCTRIRNLESYFDNVPVISAEKCINFVPTNYKKYVKQCERLWSDKPKTGQYIFNSCDEHKENAISLQETLIYHTLWMGGFPFNPLGSLIDSFLVTQQLHRSKLIIWLYPSLVTDIDPQMKAYMKLPNQIFEVKVFNFSVEAPHFCEDQPDFMDYLLTLIKQKRKIQQFSDIARIILLNKYGGIWVDSDVILLRDLRPFVETFGDFAPSFWSVAWNNHVIALRKNGTNSNTLQEAICKFPFNSTIDQIIDKEPDKILNYWPLKDEFYPTEPFSHRLDFQWNDGIIKYCQAKKSCQISAVNLGLFDPQWYFKLEMVFLSFPCFFTNSTR